MKYLEIRTKGAVALAVLSALTAAPIVGTAEPVAAQSGNSGRWPSDAVVTGTVIDSGNRQGVLRIQQSNGQVVTAYTNQAHRFRTGQRVEARGRLRDGAIRNASVRVVGGSGVWGSDNNITISGTVVDSGNQRNVVRIQSSGRTYTAQTAQAERFRVGERVQATGRLRGNTLSNATVRRSGGNWGGGWGNNNQSVTITGTVVDSQNQANVVRIRENGGRIYTAQTRQSERFSVGDTVEARGRLQGSTITGATVRRLGWGSGGAATRIDFTGYVVDSGNQPNVLRVRAENGTTYTVSTTSANRFRLNDRVRVNGRYNGSLVTSATVTRN